MMSIQMIFDRYFGDSDMTNVAPNTSAVTPATAAETKQIVLKDIGAKWDKFSEQELSAIKSRDDVVTQVVAKYGVEQAQAQRDVDAVLKGRQI
jgi:ornithine carbamoyltransferase